MKVCFIIPYFGKLPDYFRVFLKTCSYNKRFQWLLVTDSVIEYQLPANVQIISMTFPDLIKLVNARMGFETALDRPYKLCDFKPAYGYIFENYLSGYDFWGHCDIDTVMGNLSSFLTYDLLAKYDKLFCMGHFVLYRNTYDNNRIFMRPLNGSLLYKNVFLSNEIMTFDEEWNGKNNINQIYLSNGLSVYQTDLSANLSVWYQDFRTTTYFIDSCTGEIDFQTEPSSNSLFIWDRGDLFRLTNNNGNLIRRDYMYLHHQWRDMKYDSSLLKSSCFKIVPNFFKPIRKLPSSIQEFEHEKKKYLNTYYLSLFYRTKVKPRLSKFSS